ncbi:MAG: ABC transporter ATP-binding protein, partial [Jeotgalicoccus halophilus]|nr:ABC transporter ATP-binding protein [Jeotgalicoccus aerolatus]
FEMLSRMNIPGNNNLSGGEETKYRIVQTLSDYKMGLLLDEPTNFIDLMTIEALEKFIRAYQGTIILTSHDRQLISRTADRVYTIFEKNLIDIT